MTTRQETMIALITELIETHMEKCDEDRVPGLGHVAHVLSEVHATAANITTLENNAIGVKLELSDGTKWYVRVEQET